MDFSEYGTTGSNILLIGEATPHQAQINHFLLQKNHAVHSATDIEEALNIIDRQPPDLILIDLPALDPRTLSFRARLQPSHDHQAIPLIFISQCNAHEERHQLFANGASDYICTPIVADELHVRVASHLALRERHPGSRQDPMLPASTAKPEHRLRTLVNKEFHSSQGQLRNLVMHAHSVIEKERKRIAQDIHDELGSLLTAMRLELALVNLEIQEARHEVQQRLDSMQGILEEAIQVTRQIASELRPVVLNLGLVAAIEWLVENFRRRSGIACHLVAKDDISLTDTQATVLFRITQESLTNILRHAGASAVFINIKQENGTLGLEIADNGRGFDAETVATDAFGLLGIRERLETLAGKLSIDSLPGLGTTLRISMPIDDKAP